MWQSMKRDIVAHQGLISFEKENAISKHLGSSTYCVLGIVLSKLYVNTYLVLTIISQSSPIIVVIILHMKKQTQQQLNN